MGEFDSHAFDGLYLPQVCKEPLKMPAGGTAEDSLERGELRGGCPIIELEPTLPRRRYHVTIAALNHDDRESVERRLPIVPSLDVPGAIPFAVAVSRRLARVARAHRVAIARLEVASRGLPGNACCRAPCARDDADSAHRSALDPP